MKQHSYKRLAGRVCACLLSLVVTAGAWADEYPVASIPQAIKEKANAVVRLEQRSIVQKDLNESTEKVTLVISVLNKRGDDHSEFVISQDKFSELRSFSGQLLSETGRVIRKIGKGDLRNTQISDNLATDSYWTYYSCSAPSYPYTVVYNYEIRYKNGVAWYPPFIPQSFGVGVEKAEYKLTVPDHIGIRYKGNAFASEPQKEKIANDSVYTWTCSNLEVIEREPLCPPIYTLSPYVMIAPGDFCMDKICGNMSSWKNTGKYQSQLIEGKDILPPETIQKIKTLIAGADNEKEIVKRLYEHLQQTTRYVSIQLGIGGWMPIPADKVAKAGFGDCKALTNYMKAMLAVAGLPSVYATVNTDRKEMQEDFSSMFQSNHVILMVPLKEDSLWLECTSQQLPFNYIHNRISGHHTLLVDGENSKLCRVKDISAKENKESRHFDIHISPDGSISSEIRASYRNQEIEGLLDFVNNFPERDKINFLAERLSISKPQISQIQASFIPDEIPEIHVAYKLDAEKYASVTGSRLFIPTNPQRAFFRSIFSSSERKQDILLPSVINSTDSITFHLPEGYKIESCPKPFILHSEFGTYSCLIQPSEGKIRFIHHLTVPAGRYKKEQYKDLRDLFGKIDSGMAGRLVITPKKNEE